MIAYQYTASLGGVQLDDVADLAGSYGRRTVQYQAYVGDGAMVEDVGQEARTYQLSATLTGSPSEVAKKRLALIEFAGTGETRTFIHPIDGAIPVRVSALEVQDSTAHIVRITLQETRPFTYGSEVLLSGPTLSDVEAAANDALDAMRAVGSTSDVATSTYAAAEQWSDDTTPSRIEQDLESTKASLDAESRIWRASTNAAQSAALRKATVLQGIARRYAETVKQRARSYGEIVVSSSTPLVSLLTGIYGATECREIIDDVIARNGIAYPSLIPSGTTLQVPQR